MRKSMLRFAPLCGGMLLLLLAFSSVTHGQLLLNEVDTGDFDAGELFNTGSAPVNVNGWTVQEGAIDASQTWINTSLALGNLTIPAGGRLVIRENTGTAVAPGALIVNQATNIPWPTAAIGARGGDWVLVNSSSQGVDMVIWNNPAGANNFFGATFGSSYLPNGSVFGRNSNTDTDTAADWSVGSPTMGALNPGQSDPTLPILDLFVATNGMGSLTWQVDTSNPALPGGNLVNLISLQDTQPDGSGPVFGVGFDALVELTLNESPWRETLDANGSWGIQLPSFTVPSGLHAEFVAFTLTPAGTVGRLASVQSLDF